MQDRFYPNVECYAWKKQRKKVSNWYKSPRGFLVGGLLYRIIFWYECFESDWSSLSYAYHVTKCFLRFVKEFLNYFCTGWEILAPVGGENTVTNCNFGLKSNCCQKLKFWSIFEGSTEPVRSIIRFFIFLDTPCLIDRPYNINE